MRFAKVWGFPMSERRVTAHKHVRVQFRCLGNCWALSLKPHQKQAYLFRARSFITKHGVLLVHIFIHSCENEWEGKEMNNCICCALTALSNDIDVIDRCGWSGRSRTRTLSELWDPALWWPLWPSGGGPPEIHRVNREVILINSYSGLGIELRPAMQKDERVRKE